MDTLRDATDSDGRVALHMAGAAGRNGRSSAHEAGAEPDHPQLRDKRTSLHLAAIEGHANTVECLLGCGAGPGVVDSRGKTPLQLAAGTTYDTCVVLAAAQNVPCPMSPPGLTPQDESANSLMLMEDSDLDLALEDEHQQPPTEESGQPRAVARTRVAVPSDSEEDEE